MTTYKVKKGDTLWGIAQDQCGDGQAWSTIYAENRNIIGDDPNFILPGQVLDVNCPTTGGTKYVVKPGDNLTFIAKKVCHNSNWQKIYDENKNVIGDDPDLIFPGQVLHITC
jgi:nucleoid-associated protein YgaU